MTELAVGQAGQGDFAGSAFPTLLPEGLEDVGGDQLGVLSPAKFGLKFGHGSVHHPDQFFEGPVPEQGLVVFALHAPPVLAMTLGALFLEDGLALQQGSLVGFPRQLEKTGPKQACRDEQS